MAKSEFKKVVDPFDSVDDMVYALQEGDVREAFGDKFDDMVSTIVTRTTNLIHMEPDHRVDELLKYVYARLKDVYVAMEECENKVHNF